MTYKGFEVDDVKVDELVEKLGCSIVEACECILDDEGKIETPREEVAPQKRRYEKSEKARKKTTKERKVDAVKLHFLNEVPIWALPLGRMERLTSHRNAPSCILHSDTPQATKTLRSSRR